jgi:hypothetical protein
MKRIIQIKIVLLLVITFFVFNQCGNPYTPRPTELKFSGGGDAGVLSTNASLDSFEKTVYRVTRKNCIGCHSSQNPIHASDDVKEAHDIVVNQFKVNFANVPNSRLVAKLRDEAHNCWSDCSEDALEMQEAIEQWADVVNAQVELEDEEEDGGATTGGSNTGSGTTTVVTPGISSLAAFSQTVHEITKVRCTTCHITRRPFHASPSNTTAHNGILDNAAVDFNNVINSRLVQRLANDGHYCWTNCADDANEMKAAIDSWKALQEDTVVEVSNDGKTTTLSLSVAQVIATNPVNGQQGAGYLEYDISTLLGTTEEVMLRFKVSEYDEYSYLIWDPEILSNTVSVKVKGIKTLINGYYNPQHSVYTVVDTTTTPQMRSVSSSYLLALKDKGINIDKFSFQFEIIQVDN